MAATASAVSQKCLPAGVTRRLGTNALNIPKSLIPREAHGKQWRIRAANCRLPVTIPTGGI